MKKIYDLYHTICVHVSAFVLGVHARILGLLLCSSMVSAQGLESITNRGVNTASSVGMDLYKLLMIVALLVFFWTLYDIHAAKKKRSDAPLEMYHKTGLFIPILIIGGPFLMGATFESFFGQSADISFENAADGGF